MHSCENIHFNNISYQTAGQKGWLKHSVILFCYSDFPFRAPELAVLPAEDPVECVGDVPAGVELLKRIHF